MLRCFLERMLCGPSGMATVGVPVPIDGQDRLLFARLANILSDGDGHRMGWAWKGASSMKPCFKHFNVLKKDSDLAHRKPGFVEICCTDRAQVRSWSASQLFKTADYVAGAAARLAAGTMSKTDYDDVEKMVGLNHVRNGMLMSNLLRRCVTAVHHQ